MKLHYAFFARAVDLSPDGLFSVIGGGIDALAIAPAGSPVSPGVNFGSLALLVRLGFERNEVAKTHILEIEGKSPSGRSLKLGKIDLNVGPRTDLLETQTGVTTGITLVNFGFAEAGSYEFRISVDNAYLGSVSLYVTIPPSKNGDA